MVLILWVIRAFVISNASSAAFRLELKVGLLAFQRILKDLGEGKIPRIHLQITAVGGRQTDRCFRVENYA